MNSDTLYLVSCVGQKCDTPAPAAELYTSQWFKLARAYVEAQGAPWRVLSALHGLLHPEQVVAPYEFTLHHTSPPVLRQWTAVVVADLLRVRPQPARVVIFAGRRYRLYLVSALEARGYAVEVPMAGLGIGQQLGWLSRRVREAA
jgi:hypothetical protein